MRDDAESFDGLLTRIRGLPSEQSVVEARAFFTDLRPEVAAWLADERPDQVGELDGAPAALRYRANRLRLVRARDELRLRVGSGTATDRDRTRLATFDEMLTPVQEVGTDEAGRPAMVARDRQFLSLRTDGAGRVVEVRGDLDRAGNIAVLVPGMGNSLETLRGQAARAQAIRSESGPGTAAVVWLGYDSPQGVPEAASKQRAWDAVPALRRFQLGLATETRPEATTTLLGHSYGSLVAGQAVLHGARFDNLVLTGSPGIDPSVRSAADLAPRGTKVFAARSPGDYVSYTQWHGPDPASYPDVVRMQTAGGDPVRWHNEYHRPNSESLRNLGRVVRGDHAAVTTTDTSPSAETRLVPGLSWAPAVRGVAAPVSLVYDGVAGLSGVKPPPRADEVTRSPWRKDGPGNRPEGPAR